MERTEYFNNTKPGQHQLNNTEDSKIRAILRRARSNAQFGIQTGFRVTINSANSLLIDIGPGTGYTGGFFPQENLRGDDYSGERISTVTDSTTGQTGYRTTATGLGLADYTLNTKNYVSLVYGESSSEALQERYFPFTAHNTIIAETFTSEVLTETQWNALDDDDKENRILVAIITAQGAGVALSLANVQQFIQPKTHPTVGNQPTNVTGVSIVGMAPGTLIGSGTLRFEASTKKLYWTSPGDAEGTGVTITDSSEQTLYSDDTSYYITVTIIYAGLPAADASDTITVESLYGRNIPMSCSIDQAHRDMIGTGIITENNPHGLSADDLTGGAYDHADLFHTNGISLDAESDQLACSSNAATDSVEIVNNGGYRNSFLVDGIPYQLITGYAAGAPGIVPFDTTPTTPSGSYLVYIDSAGEPQKVRLASYAPADAADLDVLFTADLYIVDMHNEAAGTGTIFWDSATRKLTYQSPGDAGAGVNGATVISNTHGYGYYKLYGQNTNNWVLLYTTTGNLGVTANSSFTVNLNETDQPEESILKLCTVVWNDIGELLGTPIDTRRFNTADNRSALEEEHDQYGNHNKVLQQRLRVHANSLGIFGHVSANTAFYGVANSIGAYMHVTEVGYSAYAELDYGAKFMADRSYAVYAHASAFGVYARATGNYAIYGTADGNVGIVGVADNTAGSFSASTDRGILVTADNTAGELFASGASALYAHASSTVVYAYASDAIGAIISAANNTGVYAHAASYGIVARANGNFAGSFTAADSYGILVDVGGRYGISARAALQYGGYFSASSYGACGIANAEYGVYGQASNYGGYFTATGANSDIAMFATVGGAAGTAAYMEGTVAFHASGGLIVENTPANGHNVSEEEIPIYYNGNLRYLRLWT